MAIFNIVSGKTSKYSAVIYSVSYVNPVQYLGEVTREMREQSLGTGYVLFDLLLTNGDNFNRFAEAYFDGSEIKMDTVSVVEIRDPSALKKYNAFYRGKTKELNSSVLTPREKVKFARA